MDYFDIEAKSSLFGPKIPFNYKRPAAFKNKNIMTSEWLRDVQLKNGFAEITFGSCAGFPDLFGGEYLFGITIANPDGTKNVEKSTCFSCIYKAIDYVNSLQ